MFINENCVTGRNVETSVGQVSEIDTIRGDLCTLLSRLQDACADLNVIGDRLFGPTNGANGNSEQPIAAAGGSIHDLRDVVGGYDRTIERVRNAISRLEKL